MAEDINAVLRAQLVKDRDAEAPRIRGFPDITHAPVSSDLTAALNQQLTVRERRRDLIQAVLNEMDRTVTALAALEADGWPAPVSLATLSVALFKELQGVLSDADAAVAVFNEELTIVGAPVALIPNPGVLPTEPGP